MKLLYQTHSPYARKVLVFAYEAGLAGGLEVIHHETSPTQRNPEVFALNPLGKVPVLLTRDGEAIFDSDVICEHLDGLHAGPKLIPAEGQTRWRALTIQSVAQGLCDAGIAVRWETERRPETFRYPPFRDGQIAKLQGGYDWLEHRLKADEPLHVGHIAVATALSWLEFRELPSFRPGRPRLAAWFEAFSERPSMRATPLTGETHD